MVICNMCGHELDLKSKPRMDVINKGGNGKTLHLTVCDVCSKTLLKMLKDD